MIKRPIGSLLGNLPNDLLFGQDFSNTAADLSGIYTWSWEQARKYQLSQLVSLLQLAETSVPYYRKLFAEIGYSSSDVKSTDDLSSLPLLTRSMVNELGKDLVPDGVDYRSARFSTTGGTSGTPLGLYISHQASASEWAFMLHNWSRAGFKPKEKRAVIRGRLIKGRQSGSLWEEDPINRAIYFSSFDLSDENISKYLRVIKRYHPRYLHAYPSSATILAEYLEKHSIWIPSIKGLLLGSEMLYPAQRVYLERVFSAPVFSWYGHTEKCILAGECNARKGYHVYPQYGITELISNDGKNILRSGFRGILVGTGFINRSGTILIRYVTDDEAEWVEANCPCGWATQRIDRIQGHRTQEVLIGKSGFRISMAAMNLHSSAYMQVKQFQFFQDTPGQAVIRIVKPKSSYEDTENAFIAEFRTRLAGEIDLSVEYVEQILPSRSGKIPIIDQRIPLTQPY